MDLIEEIEAVRKHEQPLQRATEYQLLLFRHGEIHPVLKSFVQVYIGFSYQQGGAFASALQWYDKALSGALHPPLRSVVLQNKGAALFGLKQRREAISTSKDAQLYAKQERLLQLDRDICANISQMKRCDPESIEFVFTCGTSLPSL